MADLAAMQRCLDDALNRALVLSHRAPAVLANNAAAPAAATTTTTQADTLVAPATPTLTARASPRKGPAAAAAAFAAASAAPVAPVAVVAPKDATPSAAASATTAATSTKQTKQRKPRAATATTSSKKKKGSATEAATPVIPAVTPPSPAAQAVPAPTTPAPVAAPAATPAPAPTTAASKKRLRKAAPEQESDVEVEAAPATPAQPPVAASPAATVTSPVASPTPVPTPAPAAAAAPAETRTPVKLRVKASPSAVKAKAKVTPAKTRLKSSPPATPASFSAAHAQASPAPTQDDAGTIRIAEFPQEPIVQPESPAAAAHSTPAAKNAEVAASPAPVPEPTTPPTPAATQPNAPTETTPGIDVPPSASVAPMEDIPTAVVPIPDASSQVTEPDATQAYEVSFSQEDAVDATPSQVEAPPVSMPIEAAAIGVDGAANAAPAAPLATASQAEVVVEADSPMVDVSPEPVPFLLPKAAIEVIEIEPDVPMPDVTTPVSNPAIPTPTQAPAPAPTPVPIAAASHNGVVRPRDNEVAPAVPVAPAALSDERPAKRAKVQPEPSLPAAPLAQEKHVSLVRLAEDVRTRQALLQMFDMTDLSLLVRTCHQWRSWVTFPTLSSPDGGAPTLPRTLAVPPSSLALLVRSSFAHHYLTRLELSNEPPPHKKEDHAGRPLEASKCTCCSSVVEVSPRTIFFTLPHFSRLSELKLKLQGHVPALNHLRMCFGALAAKLTKLEVRVCGNQADQHAKILFEAVGMLTHLRELRLRRCCTDDLGSASIASIDFTSLPLLQKLNTFHFVRSCDKSTRLTCSPAQIEALGRCATLTDLDINTWSFDAADPVRTAAQQIEDGLGAFVRGQLAVARQRGISAPPMKDLHLSSQVRVSSCAFQQLLQLPGLTALPRCFEMTQGQVAQLPRFGGLKQLHLSGEQGLTSEMLVPHLLQCSAGMEHLELRSLVLSPSQMDALLSRLSSLRTLVLIDVSVESLASVVMLKRLSTLRLRRCTGVDGKPFQSARIPSRPGLRLDLNDTA